MESCGRLEIGTAVDSRKLLAVRLTIRLAIGRRLPPAPHNQSSRGFSRAVFIGGHRFGGVFHQPLVSATSTKDRSHAVEILNGVASCQYNWAMRSEEAKAFVRRHIEDFVNRQEHSAADYQEHGIDCHPVCLLYPIIPSSIRLRRSGDSPIFASPSRTSSPKPSRRFGSVASSSCESLLANWPSDGPTCNTRCIETPARSLPTKK